MGFLNCMFYNILFKINDYICKKEIMRNQKKKMIVLPGLVWDNEAWVPFTKYEGFACYTDRVLSEILNVTQPTVSNWRKSGIIPFTMSGSFAQYSVNEVIRALLKAGYTQDSNLKSRSDEK